MSRHQSAELQIVACGSITPALATAATHWHSERSTPCPVNDSWLELVCAYGEEPSGEGHAIRLAAPPSDVAVGDIIDLADTESLSMILQSPPAEAFDVGGVQLTERTGLPSVGCLDTREDPPQRLSLAHRLDPTARGWAAHCDRPRLGRYDELLAQLEAMYPEVADPAEMVTVARAALPHLREVPAAALGQNVFLAPQTSSGIIHRGGRGGRFLFLPIVVLLNWGAATRDLDLIAEVEQAVNRVAELRPWADACATVRDRTEAVAMSTVRSGPVPASSSPNLRRCLTWTRSSSRRFSG